MSSPRVSVLLPLRDAAAFLAPCLRSLQRQSLEDFEVLAIDDGSTDATAAVFAAQVHGDPRFRLLPAAGGGLVDALNQAASLARGPWLARMDGDDLAHPRRLELQLRMAAAHGELDVVSSLVRMFPRPLGPGMARYEHWINALQTHEQMLGQLGVESPLAHPSVLIRRSAFEAAAGYRAGDWPEDYDLWLRMAAAGSVFAKVPRVLLYWRDHAGRASRTMAQYRAEAFRRCKLEHLLRTQPVQRGFVVLGAGPTGKPWARLLLDRGLKVHAFVDLHPRRVGKRIAGVPVIGYEELPFVGPAILLGAVGREGAREQILEWFETHPRAEGQVLVLVA